MAAIDRGAPSGALKLGITTDDVHALDASRTLRESLRATLESGALDSDAQNLASALGRVLAQCKASPTLAATILDPFLESHALSLLRATVLEAYVATREELRALEDAEAWELPACAVALGSGRFAVCASPPHEDDAATAWADRVAAGLVKRSAKEVVLSGVGTARAHLEEALALVGIPFVAESEVPSPSRFRLRLPWSK